MWINTEAKMYTVRNNTLDKKNNSSNSSEPHICIYCKCSDACRILMAESISNRIARVCLPHRSFWNQSIPVLPEK